MKHADRVRELVPLAARHQLVPIIPRVGGCTKMVSVLSGRSMMVGSDACLIKHPPQLLRIIRKNDLFAQPMFPLYASLGGQPRTRSAASTRSSRPYSMWAATRYAERCPTIAFGATDPKFRFAMLWLKAWTRGKPRPRQETSQCILLALHGSGALLPVTLLRHRNDLQSGASLQASKLNNPQRRGPT